MSTSIKPTKIDSTHREHFFDRIKQARTLATEIFGSVPSYKTTLAIYERVFLIGDTDEPTKPGKLNSTQQNMVEDLLACVNEVPNTFGEVPASDRADAAIALYDVTYGPDYLDDEDDLDEDDE